MLTDEISVNGKKFRVILTDPIIEQTKQLKNLYSTAYEDTESFEQLSTEISNTIQSISAAAEPQVSGEELDGFIQEVIRIVDKSEEANKETKSASRKERNSKKIKP